MEPLRRSENAIHIKYFTDNKLIFDSQYSSKTLKEKRLILDETAIKDMIAQQKSNNNNNNRLCKID